MAKLTKVQRAAIASALRSVEAAIGDIMSPRVALCYKGRENIATSHGVEYRAAPETVERVDYIGRDDARWHIDYVATMTETAKHSRPFVQAYDAVRILNGLLDGGEA